MRTILVILLGIILCIAVEFLMIWLFPGRIKLAQGLGFVVGILFIWFGLDEKTPPIRY